MKGTRWRWMGWLWARRGPRTKNYSTYYFFCFVFCLYSFVMALFLLFILMLILFVKERECRSCEK
jgi:hypothetical protein